MRRLALAALSVSAVASAGWWVFQRYSDMQVDLVSLGYRLGRLEAPHDALDEEIEIPEEWLR